MSGRSLETKGEIDEARTQKEVAISEKLQELNTVRNDLGKVRETLRSLDLKGTTDFRDEVQQDMDGAKKVTTEVFDGKSEELARHQEDHQETSNSLAEKKGTDEADHTRIGEAEAAVETVETKGSLDKAKESVLRDIDFLDDEIRQIQEDIERSKQEQQAMGDEVHSDGG